MSTNVHPTIFTRADRDVAECLFARIADATGRPGEGIYRRSYGADETMAWQLVAEEAQRLGLRTRADAACNLVITRDVGPPPPRAIWIGSHLDSVPSGGNYDGLAGVVAAVLVLAKAREREIDLPLVGLGLRGEESAWFGVPYLGSKALLGKLSKRDLDRTLRGTGDVTDTLGDCMRRLGIDPECFVETPIVPPDQIAAFWELHIEQGPLLVARDKPVGVVTGIRGNVRAGSARIVGRAGHSGTTPHELRDDAVVHFVEVMTKLEAQRRVLAENGDDLVFTCGIVGTDPAKHAITTIADEVRLVLDVRSLDDRLARDFLNYAQSLGVELGEVVQTPSAVIPRTIWEKAVHACEVVGVTPAVLPSGAGHDAAVFQQAGIPSGMIFVRNENGSHNPAEAMDMDDFLIGCEVLWRTIVGADR